MVMTAEMDSPPHVADFDNSAHHKTNTVNHLHV